ncbi:di-heme oxidoredictase family protein [Catenovulum maritimum]|uniref:Thiol oxidoreductase n=1 Tax=Catenovulum maritimum TaxID=1513271 RepID=A0A0J8GT31_9ALTE|nr:di-heme oxidoredictase family protein [Catenovulum maritimum]KMT64449.1 thiol oxidoreductase [Catenovulum maritimum]
MKKKLYTALFCFCALGLISSCGKQSESTDDANKVALNENLGGGQSSVKDITADAFSEHSSNMTDPDRIALFNLGNDFFQNPWVEGSASTSSRDGLGGLFNNDACQDCHIRDGRGHAPKDQHDTDFDSILFRTAKANITTEQENQMLSSLIANVPDSYFGGQLQQHGISNLAPEVKLSVQYSLKTVEFTDGTKYQLRQPNWQIQSNIENKAFEVDTIFSARVSPAMIGLGLLELIAESDILAKQDIHDANGDGISGKANYVWSVQHQAVQLGRFGWKAGQPSLLEQSAGAFVNDMGLTNRFHQTETCTVEQLGCKNAPNGNGDSVNQYDYEVSDIVLDAIGFYSSHLAVPERRNINNEQVLRGKALFARAGCLACHTEHYKTERDSEQPELSEQDIFPYTDMLLHDMGAELADFNQQNQAADSTMLYEFLATASEWRTPPLWGIGLAKTVDPNATFLHDGRAQTIMEAVLWHGGEAEMSKQKVLDFNQAQREDLLAFLNDL